MTGMGSLQIAKIHLSQSKLASYCVENISCFKIVAPGQELCRRNRYCKVDISMVVLLTASLEDDL